MRLVRGLRWLVAAPELEDDDLVRSAAVLRTTLMGVIAVSLPSTVLLFLVLAYQPVMAGVSLVSVAVYTALLATCRLGHVRAAGWGLALFMWAVVTGIALFSGGPRSPILWGFTLIVVGSGYILGRQACAVTVVLSTLTCGALLVLEDDLRTLRGASEFPSSVHWMFQTFAFVLLFAVIQLSTRHLYQALSRVRQQNDELRTAQQALEARAEELTRARDRAEAATQAKREFLATMSHEIRTPVNAVTGMAQLLAGTRLDDTQQDYLSTIETSTNALMVLIDDILDFSRIEAGHLELSSDAFDLGECIDSAIDLSAPRAADKGLYLGYWMGADVPGRYVGDHGRLRQVLTNLLDNAIKFTHEGSVVLRVTRGPGTEGEVSPLLFEIRDTGVGIPQEHRDRIFQIFTQADMSTTRTFGGTGLGLSICESLVERMGGRIWFDSRVGEGTTFSFTVSLPPHDAPPPLRPEHRLRGKHLLVADDREASRQLLGSQAEAWGMQITACTRGSLAQVAVEDAADVDVVIAHDPLPDMSGEQLAAAIHSRPSTARVPVVLSTGHGRGRAWEPSKHVAARMGLPIKATSLGGLLAQVVSPSGLATAPRSTADPTPDSPSLRILLAEDNPINRKVALRMLDRLGHQASSAENGQQALEALHQQAYDVVLMDLHMPVLDGLTATQRIREELEQDRQPYIIAVTADAEKDTRTRCLGSGMNDYLTKPPRLERLVEALEHLPRHALVGARG